MFLEEDHVSRARLLDTALKESGTWPNALPVSSNGTLLDSESFRVVIALELALMFAFPIFVAAAGGWMHGFSWKYSAGGFKRYSTINDVIKRALQEAGLSSVLKPPVLGCPDTEISFARSWQTGSQAGFWKYGNTLESTHWELLLILPAPAPALSVWTPM